MLIPKKSKHETLGDFHPIAPCNTMYRLILDGILTIQETIHSACQGKDPCMFMKLNIQKAYDMVD